MSTTEVQPRRHRITVEEYDRMGKVGLFAPDARVELIHGEVMDMPPKGSLHAEIVTRLSYALISAVGGRGVVRCQQALRLGEQSQPEPDLAVVKPRNYCASHPAGSDTLLVVEASDSTFRYDRDIKLPLYASYGIPEVWIVDLRRRRVFFFRSPTGRGYEEASTGADSGEMGILALPGVTVSLAGLWRD